MEGGNLASIETQEEQDTVSKLAEVSGTWIGLSDILSEGNAAWADGAPVSFTNWRTSQPNNGGMGQHCVWIRGTDAGNDDGKWDDIICNKMNAYACQKALN
jgi:low affinity IgE Fc receptor